MEVPHQYPYNPPLWLILLLLGTGFLWIAVDWFPYWLPGGHIPTGFSFWFSLVGLIPIALAFIVGVFRISFESYLLLDNDSMVLPLGLFQMRRQGSSTPASGTSGGTMSARTNTDLCSRWRPKSRPFRFCPPFFQTTRAIARW